MGKEKRPEYNDPTIKRSFAAFFNAFTEQGFRKRMDKDRKVEDLVLIFYSNATKELQKGKTPADDSWKYMVDRHVALFVRLISIILKDHDWAKERPELASRLSLLESKLLAHDQDLSAQTNGGQTTIEVVVPRSYEVKDMPLVQVVARIFGLTSTQIQSDIDKNKSTWTAEAALKDLKTYQTLLNLKSRKVLRNDDFDFEEAYESWKKAEGPELSQMMLAIMQTNPELTKGKSRNSIHQLNTLTNSSETSEASYSDASRKMSEVSEGSSYVIDQPVDMSALNTAETNSDIHDDENPFTFIPPDPRAYYRFILAEIVSYELRNKGAQTSNDTAEIAVFRVLSKSSMDLLNEICFRWRLPHFSRTVIFLDVIRDKFLEQEISLETLDEILYFLKEAQAETRKGPNCLGSLLSDRTKWTLSDFILLRQILTTLHDNLLRDVYDIALHCYEDKPPPIGYTLHVLHDHIYDDPSFSQASEEQEEFKRQLHKGLQDKAFELYKTYLEKHLPQDQQGWQFYHVIELGKAVLALAQRIQKRYRKNPEIMGYSSSKIPIM